MSVSECYIALTQKQLGTARIWGRKGEKAKGRNSALITTTAPPEVPLPGCAGGERRDQTVINETSRVCVCVCICNPTCVHVHERDEPGCVHVSPVPCNVPAPMGFASRRPLNTSVASPPRSGQRNFSLPEHHLVILPPKIFVFFIVGLLCILLALRSQLTLFHSDK